MPDAANSSSLTESERAVIKLVVYGLSDRQIAARISLTDDGVKESLAGIYIKTGVSDRLELIIYAIAHGLAEPLR